MDLFRNGLIPDPFWGANERHLQWIEETDWIYQTEFDLQIPDCEHIELVAHGLDTVTEIRLNDGLIARTDNMFTGYRYDIRTGLKQQKIPNRSTQLSKRLHINLLGRYAFSVPEAVTRGELRPLRNPAEVLEEVA